MLQISEYTQIVAIGDVHGDLPRLVATLQAIQMIRVMDQKIFWTAPPGTVLVQMGDQIDSAPRGADDNGMWELSCDLRVLEFMTSLEMMASSKGCRVINILGNHELMNLYGDMSYVSDRSLRSCGGYTSRSQLLKPGSEYVRRHLAPRHLACIVGGFLFCHAGILPEHVRSLGIMQREVRLWMETGEPMSADVAERVVGKDGILWTRRYTEPRADADAQIVHDHLGTKCMVVGHTVVPSIVTTPLGKVMFIDTGLSRSMGGNDPEVLHVGPDGCTSRVRVKMNPLR